MNYIPPNDAPGRCRGIKYSGKKFGYGKKYEIGNHRGTEDLFDLAVLAEDFPCQAVCSGFVVEHLPENKLALFFSLKVNR